MMCGRRWDIHTRTQLISVGPALLLTLLLTGFFTHSRLQDLRQEIRELIIQGKTDQEIKDYLVARYGDFVLYRPPVQNNTLLAIASTASVLPSTSTASLRHWLRCSASERGSCLASRVSKVACCANPIASVGDGGRPC